MAGIAAYSSAHVIGNGRDDTKKIRKNRLNRFKYYFALHEGKKFL